MENLTKLKKKAFQLGATKFGKSPRKTKRFYVQYDGVPIHFGSKNGRTFIDHGNEGIKEAWKARHSKIKLKDGRYAWRVKQSPEYWSWRILWD